METKKCNQCENEFPLDNKFYAKTGLCPKCGSKVITKKSNAFKPIVLVLSVFVVIIIITVFLWVDSLI
jgi:DNA-directed RNA polymerase subunit RPC12/RpoP